MRTSVIESSRQKLKDEINFPCLMRHWDGTIVLATNASDGVVVQWPLSRRAGETVLKGGCEWAHCGYTPMRGKVTIEFDMEDGQ